MQQLKINTSNRVTATDSPADFTIVLTQPISGRWNLKQAMICADFFNVNSTNNKIPFYENLTQKSATLPVGYYSSSQIVAALQVALNSASGGFNTYTCTFSTVNQQVIIAATSAFVLQWATVPANSAVSLLGFSVADSVSGLSVTSPSIVTPSAVLNFNISIENLGSFIDSRGQVTTFSIPLNVNIGPQGWTLYEPDRLNQQVEFKSPLKLLRIRVTDDAGNVLGLKQNWFMILESSL